MIKAENERPAPPAPIATINYPVPTAPELEVSAFSPMLQGTGSNRFSQISTRTSAPEIDNITGVATVALDNWTLKLDGYASTTGIRPSTHKLLNACVIALTSRNSYRGSGNIETFVDIPLREYAELLGKQPSKASIDDVRKKVKEDLETLFQCRLSWKEKKGTKSEDFADVRIISSKEIRAGIIRVGFSPELAKYLTGAYIMQFPKALFRVDERNPSTIVLGRKLAFHFGVDNNQQKGTANIISVKSLLAECQQTIPGHDVVINSDKRVGDRIIKPFEDALNSLDFVTWEYANAKGVPLTDAQLENPAYTAFIKWFVKFEIKDFPDQTTRLEARADESKPKPPKKSG